MWPFDRTRTEAGRPVDSPQQTATSADVVARLFELETRTERLEKLAKGLDTDWSEWYDKFRRLYARIAKRQERDEDTEQSRQDAPESTNGTNAHTDVPLALRAGGARIPRRNY